MLNGLTFSLYLPIREKVPGGPEMYDVSYNKMRMTTVILSSSFASFHFCFILNVTRNMYLYGSGKKKSNTWKVDWGDSRKVQWTLGAKKKERKKERNLISNLHLTAWAFFIFVILSNYFNCVGLDVLKTLSHYSTKK